jgi:nucleoside 2-deoxyribosyltransferase
MKIQLAYKYTGEDKQKVVSLLEKVRETLKKRGCETYVPVFDKSVPESKKELFNRTLNKIDEQDILLVLLFSEDKSEGMLLEIGYCLAKQKKFILAINKDIKNTHLRDLADDIIEFLNLEDLIEKLKNLDFQNVRKK